MGKPLDEVMLKQRQDIINKWGSAYEKKRSEAISSNQMGPRDGMHIGCLNGTVLKELQIVYRMDMRHFGGRRTLRGLRRRDKDFGMRDYEGVEHYDDG